MCTSSRLLQTGRISLRQIKEYCSAYQWNDFSRVLCEILRKLVIVDDKVGDVDVAVVLLHQDIFADLVSAMVSDHLASIVLSMHTCR